MLELALLEDLHLCGKMLSHIPQALRPRCCCTPIYGKQTVSRHLLLSSVGKVSPGGELALKPNREKQEKLFTGPCLGAAG